jgi:hypothetical protein
MEIHTMDMGIWLDVPWAVECPASSAPAVKYRCNHRQLRGGLGRKALGASELTFTSISSQVTRAWPRLAARAASKARIATLRRDSARRSYRSMAASCPVMSARMVANFCGPSRDDCTDLFSPSKTCGTPRWLTNFGCGVCSGNFARQCLNLFRQSAIGKDGQA